MIGFLRETVTTVKQAKRQDFLIFCVCFVVSIAFIYVSFLLINEFSEYFFGSQGTGTENSQSKNPALSDEVIDLAETLRNAAWVLWVGLTISSLIVGFGILNRGQEQKRERLDHEIYATNLNMLASDSTMVRIVGVRWLQSMIKEDFNAGKIYFESLIEYIRNPYMRLGEGNNPDDRFPADKELPDDIQEAANGLYMFANFFHDNESVKEKLEFPKSLWKKNSKYNNRQITKKAIRKGIKAAVSEYYKEKLSDCILCKLLYFVRVIPLYPLLAIVIFCGLAVFFSPPVIISEFFNLLIYIILACFNLGLEFINWVQAFSLVERGGLLVVFISLLIIGFKFLYKFYYSFGVASSNSSSRIESYLCWTLEKIGNGKYKILCLIASPVNEIILRTEKEMKNSENYGRMRDHTWQKEKDNFYEDMQKEIKKIFTKHLESSRGKIRTDDVKDLPKKIKEKFESACKELNDKDRESENLKITLPSYFWKNKNKSTVSFPSAMLGMTDKGKLGLLAKKAEMKVIKDELEKMKQNDTEQINNAEIESREEKLKEIQKEIAKYMNDMEAADLFKANLAGAILTNTNLNDAKLQCANLEGANLSHTSIDDANFSWANLARVIMKPSASALGCNAKFNQANLYRAKMIQLHNHLKGCDFTCANLEEVEFCKRDGYVGPTYTDDDGNKKPSFFHTDLEGVEFDRANLSGAVMNLVTGLTKKQILSAHWGINMDGKGERPLLPDELKDGTNTINTKRDPEIQKWLEKPHYDLSTISPSDWEKWEEVTHLEYFKLGDEVVDLDFLTSDADETLQEKMEDIRVIGGRTWKIRSERKTDNPTG